MRKNLIVDINNLAFTALNTSKIKPAKTIRQKEKYAKEFIFKTVLDNILYHAAKFGCSAIVIAADSKKVWRKDFYPEYKANHDEHDNVYYDDVIAAIELLREFFEGYTGAYYLSVPKCEADDIIAVWCQSSEGVQNIILSSDKDFIQLVSDETSLYSPPQKKFRETIDPQYDLFVKCIRGDRGDNIHSAFPKVRETRLKKAWEDELEMMNLINEKHPIHGNIVGEHLEFNQKLIDLREQPIEIRVDILNAINTYTNGKFDEIKAMRFLKENNLGAFVDSIRNAVPLRNVPKLKDN